MARTKTKSLGQPTKCTPERTKKILDAIRAGNYLNVAAAYAGVDEVTVREWVRRGEGRSSDPERPAIEPYVSFAIAFKEAEHAWEVAATAKIALASNKQWQAAAWMLERKKPAQWGQRVVVTIEQELKSAIKRLREALPPEEYERALTAITGGSGSGGTEPDSIGEGDGESPGTVESESPVLPTPAESETE